MRNSQKHSCKMVGSLVQWIKSVHPIPFNVRVRISRESFSRTLMWLHRKVTKYYPGGRGDKGWPLKREPGYAWQIIEILSCCPSGSHLKESILIGLFLVGWLEGPQKSLTLDASKRDQTIPWCFTVRNMVEVEEHAWCSLKAQQLAQEMKTLDKHHLVG